ncbi:unnamed protein product [Mortierella alpina]
MAAANTAPKNPVIFATTYSHPGVEVSYDPSIDPALTATIPLNVQGVDYLPVSTQNDFIITRFAIGDYRFNPADVHFVDLLRFANHFAADHQMGDVIKIEVPKFRSQRGRYAYRNEFVFYTKGDREAGPFIPRSMTLEGHQINPIKIGWNGAPPICTYCKREGHFLKTCAERLSKICNNCHAPGHISAHCARFGERDRKAADRRQRSL